MNEKGKLKYANVLKISVLQTIQRNLLVTYLSTQQVNPQLMT